MHKSLEFLTRVSSTKRSVIIKHIGNPLESGKSQFQAHSDVIVCASFVFRCYMHVNACRFARLILYRSVVTLFFSFFFTSHTRLFCSRDSLIRHYYSIVTNDLKNILK